MKQWTLPPEQITIPAVGGATATSLPGSYTTYNVANGAYDENGALIFYAEANSYFISIYTASGGYVNDLNTLYSSITGYHYGNIGEELAVVPVPNSCKKYYVIWPAASTSGFTGTAVGYATIDCSSGVTISQNSTLLDIWGSTASAIAVSKVTDLGTGVRYLFAMGATSLNRYTITSTGIASKATVVNELNLGVDANLWVTSQLVLSPDQTKLAWATGGGFTNKVFQINLSGYAYQSYASYTLTGDTWLHGIEFNSTSNRIFVSTNNGLKWAPLLGAFSLISNSSTYSNCQLGLSLSTWIYCTNNSAQYGRINANAITPTVSVAPNLTSYPNYANDAYPPWNSTCYRLDDEIDGEDYSYFFGTPKANADFNINGNPIACPSYNQLYNCAAGNMLLNNLTTGPATSYTIQVKSATGIDCNTTTSTYTGPITSLGVFSTYNLKTYNTSYLTSSSHTGYYIVYLTATNSCGVSTIKQALIRVSDIGPYTANYNYLYNPTAQCTIVPGGSCATSASVTSLYSPELCLDLSTGIICEYWLRIWDYGTSCPGNQTAISDGSSNHSFIPNCSTAGLHVLLDYYIYTHPVGPQPTNYTVINTNHHYKVELNVKNDCGPVSKTAWIINNCPTCRWSDDQVAAIDEMQIVPNPAMAEISVNNIPYGTTQLQIMNLEGKVLNVNTPPNEGASSTLNITNLPAGIYLLRTVGATTTTTKFVKE